MKKLAILMLAAASLLACKPKPGPDQPEDTPRMYQIDSIGWVWQDSVGLDYVDDADFTVTQAEPVRLHFYGWGLNEDSIFTVSFPDDTEKYGRAVLTYTMGAWNTKPGEWDILTLIRIKDKATGEWYEFTKAITPYGNSFNSSWSKTFYVDITEFLPMLKGETEFCVYYPGWDATDTRAHTFQLTFSFYEGANRYGTPCGHQKIYDSFTQDTITNGYRAWPYGVTDATGEHDWSIEAQDRLGNRTVNIPAGTKKAIFRVSITGHGQDAYAGKGYFPNRDNTKAESCAEFDYNHYTIFLNGEELAQQGYIWELNDKKNFHNYYQAGTYSYSRGGWGPGKMCNIQHWQLDRIPEEGETITLNFDLEEYVSPNKKPNAEYVACYYVMVDAFFFK